MKNRLSAAALAAALAAGASGAGADQTAVADRALLPADYRTEVADTTVPPFRSIGLVQSEGADGTVHHCTGTLVGPRSVLTSAACLYDLDAGTWMENVLFAPGIGDAENAPFGIWAHEELLLPAGYIENYQGYFSSVLPWSLGLVVLEEPIGEELGWPAHGPEGDLAEGPVRTVGYYWDKPFADMWEDECTIAPHETVPHIALLSACGGRGVAIGAPVLQGDGKTARILGMQAAESPDLGIVVLPLTGPLAAWVAAAAR